MKKLLFLSLMAMLLSNKASCQENIKYDISVAGISIGELNAKKNTKEKNTVYELTSLVSFWFFGNISVNFEIISHYKDNLLIKSRTTTKSNRGDFFSKIDWINDKYEISATSYKYELDTALAKPFYFSSSRLYFEEPLLHAVFMAENYGLSSPIKKKEDHYEVSVNGNKNKFYYLNGKLEKAIMQSPIKNYVIKRKSNQ